MQKSKDSIKASESKQIAILGHALVDQQFFTRCDVWGVTEGWFNLSHMAGGVYKHLSDFVAKRHRHPTMAETLALAHLDMGKEYVDSYKATIKRAVLLSKEIGQDILIDELRMWAIGAKFVESMNPGSPLEVAFNNQDDIPKTLELLKGVVNDLTRLEEIGETTNRFQSSAERVVGERAERERLREKALKYGIQFLDDATGGIWPTDLVVIGASSGKGKTELVTGIAKHVAKQGKKVFFFALEATEKEIERRAKFPVMSKLYFTQRKIDAKAGKAVSSAHISYKDWMFGNCATELDPYEDAGDAFVQESYAGIHTYYRVCGDFTLATLQQKIREVRSEADLVIVDHLGFIGAKSGGNLYEHQAATVKALTDLAREQEVPVILVAHLRKKDRAKGAPLLADQEDFSGIGDIFQVANTCIMLSPAGTLDRADKDDKGDTINRVQEPGNRLWDTYMAVRKARTAGSDVTNATAVLQFNSNFNEYQRNYAIGRLTNNDSEWEPTNRPGWAAYGTISDILPTNLKARNAPRGK